MENAISKFLIWGGGGEKFGVEMLSRISNLGGGKFLVENVYLEISKLGGGGGWKIWGGKCYLESRIWGVENLGRKMLSRISNFGGGKFGVENVISNLEFGGWKIWGGKCYLDISKLGGGGVENLGWKMLSRISNFGGGKFGVENAISNLEIGVWKIWGGKCYLESRIWGVENLGWKMLSRISNLGCGKFGVENAISKFLIWGGGGKFGVENAIESRIWGVENLGWKMLSRISNLGGWKILGGKCCLESRIWGVENLGWKMLSRNF